MALLSNLPLLSLGNCLLCLWVWGGGILAAWLYKRLQGTVTVSDGGWLGVLAGLLGGLASALWTYAGASGAHRQQCRGVGEDADSDGYDPGSTP